MSKHYALTDSLRIAAIRNVINDKLTNSPLPIGQIRIFLDPLTEVSKMRCDIQVTVADYWHRTLQIHIDWSIMEEAHGPSNLFEYIGTVASQNILTILERMSLDDDYGRL